MDSQFFEMDSERFIATKPEGPKLINGTMIYISSKGRCQKIGPTFFSRKNTILGLGRYIPSWNFNMSRYYLFFLVNRVCFLCFHHTYVSCVWPAE